MAARLEVFTFSGLLRTLARAVDTVATVVPSPLGLVTLGGMVMSRMTGDMVITREELEALVAESLVSHEPATAPTKLTDWLNANGKELGQRYTSELDRHWRVPGAASGT